MRSTVIHEHVNKLSTAEKFGPSDSVLCTMRSIAPWRKNHPLTGYEPKLLDNFHYSETSAMIFQDESGDIDTELSYSCDAELDDETIGKALSSPLFIQEREEPADRRQGYHSFEESLLPCQSLSVCHARTGRPEYELSSC